MVRPMNDLKVLCKVLPNFSMYLTKVLKHFISNGCLSLQYIISFSVLRGYLIIWSFVCNLKADHRNNGPVRPISK